MELGLALAGFFIAAGVELQAPRILAALLNVPFHLDPRFMAN
ncbi:hypothetical protein ACVW1C_008190 [Bradyrhizobium sp. USDA 4011]